jgi:hypothetical protein
MATKVNKKLASKGVRLGWTPMKEVSSVQLTPDLVKGKKLTHKTEANQTNHKPNPTYLIP